MRPALRPSLREVTDPLSANLNVYDTPGSSIRPCGRLNPGIRRARGLAALLNRALRVLRFAFSI